MLLSISCRDLGMDCEFATESETEEKVIQAMMRHVASEHTDDWFEIEEIHEVAISLIRGNAA